MRKSFPAMIISLCCIVLLLSCDSDSAGDVKSYKNVTDFSDFSQDYISLCCDGTGGLFVSTAYQIYKIDTAGNSSLFAGNTDSSNPTDPFNLPRGMAMDNSGNLYVANDMNHDILKIDSAANVSILLGTAGSSGHSNVAPVTFNRPYDCAYDGSRNILYVADSSSSYIRKIETGNGYTVSDFAPFGYIYSVNLDNEGNVYACSGTGNTINKYSPDGTLMNTYTITSTTDPELYDLAVAADGTIYAADYNNYVIWKVSVDGTISLFAGTPGTSGSVNGSLLDSTFSCISAIDIDDDGTIYIADTDNKKIRRIALE